MKFTCKWPGHEDLPDETRLQLGCKHDAEECPERIETTIWAMNPNDPDYAHGDCGMKLGDINKDCTCGGHSSLKPVVVIMDPEFYADLRAVVLANGAEKVKLVIDSMED